MPIGLRCTALFLRSGHSDGVLEGHLQHGRGPPVAAKPRGICEVKIKSERGAGAGGDDVAEVVKAVVREQMAVRAHHPEFRGCAQPQQSVLRAGLRQSPVHILFSSCTRTYKGGSALYKGAGQSRNSDNCYLLSSMNDASLWYGIM